MDQLETAIQEIEKVESALDSYDETLKHVRDTIDKMDQKNANIQTANSNNEKLLNELQNVIVSHSLLTYLFKSITFILKKCILFIKF